MSLSKNEKLKSQSNIIKFEHLLKTEKEDCHEIKTSLDKNYFLSHPESHKKDTGYNSEIKSESVNLGKIKTETLNNIKLSSPEFDRLKRKRIIK